MAARMYCERQSSEPIREADTVVKGDNSPQPSMETSRSLSGPVGLQSPDSLGTVLRAQRRKPSDRSAPQQGSSYTAFRRICDEILAELKRIGEFFVGDEVTDEGSEIVAEVEAMLERLYNCPYGKGESLKKVVVALQSQVNNVQWERRHVEFLKESMRFLRVSYLVDEASVDACYDSMKSHHLDQFRGTVSAPAVVKHYRLEEVNIDADPDR